MNQHTMTALDFPRIQEQLATFAACQLGKELALGTRPLPTLARVRDAQAETTEAVSILQNGRHVPFGSIQDIRLYVDRAVDGAALRPEQLEAVADTIYGCRQLYRALTELTSAAPRIAAHAQAFGHFGPVEEEIRRCIERGTVSSRASRTLKQIRSEIGVLEGRIKERLQSLLKTVKAHLQDPIVTERNGHYVVPVRAASRAAVPGTVHGASASGSTLFVEPDAVRQLAAELASWRAMEESEIEQILATLSALVADHAAGLQATLVAVGKLDVIFARARLSRSWEAQPVQWNEQGLIDLIAARHPALGKGAVGNRIRMSASRRMLIITGPNTGGKTLLLKTLGILVLIAQSGMHIPAAAGSTLPFFADVLADIGDHQSIEQSLSTFSGHIANVAPMLAQASPQTLILLDELGSGTDPHEGTGLGIALLEAFLGRGAYTLATTHLRDIKEFGRLTPGCEIAGMGFDGESLAPTYQLRYGTLGESHGLEIAARNGLPAPVVERARQLVYGSAAPATAPTTQPTPEPTTAATPEPATAATPEPATAPLAPPVTAPPVATRETITIEPPPPRHRPALAGDLVLGQAGQGKVRVLLAGQERELTLLDPLRRRFPFGLLPGDRVRVRDSKVVEVLPRTGSLTHRDADSQAETEIAANLTQLLIVLSARQPDFHPSHLARHLFYAERHAVPPVIALTKADLVTDAEAKAMLDPYRRLGYPTLVLSGAKGRGLGDLSARLGGQTTGLLGSPGAGLSTLLAALLGQDLPPVPFRTGRAPRPPILSAVPMGGDGWLVQLPPLRLLGAWKPDLAGGFRDFGSFAGLCQHAGCLHKGEQGCAVRIAVEAGQISRPRYETYRQVLGHLGLA